MTKVLVIGHTGVIGRELLSQSLSIFENVIGISRHEYFRSESGLISTTSLKDSSALGNISDLAADCDLILNSAWTNNNRINRNHASHRSHCEWEKTIVTEIKGRETKYISLGSIAEFLPEENSSFYAQEKRDLSQFIVLNLKNALWVRIASAYGLKDRRDWFIPQLLSAAKSGERVAITNRDAKLNFVHVSVLAKEILDLAYADKTGAINLYTNQWYKLIDVQEGFWANEEPQVSNSPIVGLFDKFDMRAHRMVTPPLVKTLRNLVRQT